MRNFSRLVQGKHFQIGVWMKGVGKCAFFNGELAISRKRWELGPRLVLISNRKWHMPFQMKWKSLTLDDFEGHWQPVRLAVLATAGFLFIFLICSFAGEVICWSCSCSGIAVVLILRVFYVVQLYSVSRCMNKLFDVICSLIWLQWRSEWPITGR